MRVAVIGGGAAGMMAALAAAESGAQVILLEKNEKLGKKLFITGKGRCNLTNDAEREVFFTHILRNPRFLYSSYGRFDNQAMMTLLEEAGLRLKTERGGRVFPASDKSSDVIRTLEKLLDQAGVEVRLHAEVRELLTRKRARGEGPVREASGLILESGGKKEKISADRVVVATGGLSYPATGSTGDGYRFAEDCGHSVTVQSPSLVPLEAAFEGEAGELHSPADLMGLTLKNVSLAAYLKGKKVFEEQGEMMFTHFGVTGPLVLSASAVIGEALYLHKETAELRIDLKPALTREQLEARLIRETAAAGTKSLRTLLGGVLPKALIPVLLTQADLEGARKAALLTKPERQALAENLKGLKMTAKALRGFPEAIVTRGGVSVKEIDPKTMESKKVKNLYFAGEVLDLDGTTGGYNLQIAWTTGAAAGRAAAKEEEKKEEPSMNTNRNIAIDGPAGSGKSTIAKRIAKETGLIYVDTGAMYRAMAIYFLRRGLAPDDEAGITAACEKANVTIAYENGSQQVYLNDENVTAFLREEAVGQMASASSVYGAVREKMKTLQQRLGREKTVVMDGRDIGTVILPDAFLKVYMTASVEVRAKRRFEELLAKGQEADLAVVAREIEERDWRDMHREIARLKQAEDAVLLDTSDLSIDEVTDTVLKLYRERLK
ncbi:MAG: (d)CMP kinase [Lachnospiraceae bacterium]|nr:(d)CMP kinase [Lachnospiraceae bacterium]